MTCYEDQKSIFSYTSIWWPDKEIVEGHAKIGNFLNNVEQNIHIDLILSSRIKLIYPWLWERIWKNIY
jgi:hypothetical protein